LSGAVIQVTLDENPVGPRGGRALFRCKSQYLILPYILYERVHVKVNIQGHGDRTVQMLISQRRDCDIHIKGANFQIADPSKNLGKN